MSMAACEHCSRAVPCWGVVMRSVVNSDVLLDQHICRHHSLSGPSKLCQGPNMHSLKTGSTRDDSVRRLDRHKDKARQRLISCRHDPQRSSISVLGGIICSTCTVSKLSPAKQQPLERSSTFGRDDETPAFPGPSVDCLQDVDELLLVRHSPIDLHLHVSNWQQLAAHRSNSCPSTNKQASPCCCCLCQDQS